MDFNPVLEMSEKGMLGSATERNSFRLIVSWTGRSLQSCDIHGSFQFSVFVLGMLLCILDGSEYMFLVA